ncbi:MAG TPA: thioredoxin family protein [Clostridia bacterium]|nr:thioredoxin family protein [Clostridia bacterium]
MLVKILGPGCKNCQRLFQEVEGAIKEMGIEARLEKVEDLDEIISHGALRTPGLVVDGVLKVSGRIPNKEEIKKYLS